MVDVVVVGAGVAGLTAAIELQDAGYKTAVVGEIFPNDPKSTRYTSFWAGGHHATFSPKSDTKHHELHKKTFERVRKMLDDDPSLPMINLPVSEYLLTDGTSAEDQDEIAAFKDIYPYKEIPKDKLLPAAKFGFEIQTVGFDVPNYMLYLFKRYAKAGGIGAHAHLKTIRSLVDGEAKLSCVVGLPVVSQEQVKNAKIFVNATGIAGKELEDIADKDLYPIRGQTVLIRAPWIKDSFSFLNPDTKEFLTYVIPRKSGDVIVGGTFGEYEDDAEPRPELAHKILERAIALYPYLVPTEKRANFSKPQVSDVDIISHNVGFRPGRKGGVRLESQPFQGSTHNVTLIHNYGHGGTGFQTSWGSAQRVLELVKEAL